jgi:hypothetical protein
MTYAPTKEQSTSDPHGWQFSGTRIEFQSQEIL